MNESSRLIQQLIAERASTRPDDVAVVHGDERLTYRQLVTRVRSLAWRLREEHGVGRDTLVPLLFERSLDMVVGILAVIEAGGACLPLDPGHPAVRHRFILQDCGARLLLTTMDTHPSLAELVHVLDLRRPTWPERPEELPVLGTADDLVYCLYTSGSTGEPKGVLIEHRGVRNVLQWGKEYFGITPDDRVLQKTTYTFDISIMELFLPLISGARLVLLAPGAETSPPAIRETVVRHGVTLIQFVPSGLASYLAVMGTTEPLPGVTRCLVAGEPLKPGLRTTFYTSTTGCGLYNLYGPTETSIYATACLVDREAPVTVGGPLADTTLLIVDEGNKPCPVGVPGELLIAGAGLTRGYLNRDDLTRERYVADPTGGGRRMYRTGDLAIRRESGEIDLVGRMDHQVKIRGYRIELGEIDNTLSALPGVHNSAVIATEINGQQELVAYWVGDDRADTASLRAGLLESLPAYMVPARFMRLDAFPLTSSGKIQRAALPAPDLDAEFDGTAYEAPADELDREMCAVLQEVLGWGRVGLNDRFLDLGGDSLKAVRVVLLVRKRMRREVGMDALLRNETVAELTARLRAPGRSGASTALPPVVPVAPAPWHPLSSGQLSMWLLEQAGAAHAAYTVPALYELRGTLDREALHGALVALLARHEALRTAYGELAGVPVQQVRKDTTVDWEATTASDEDASDRAVAEFVQRDFDLAAGRLVRFLLVERAPDHHLLVVSAHHIAVDGWSLTVLIDDVIGAYNDLLDGRQPEMPVPAVQYKDYAHWQRGLLDRPAAEESRAYWLQRLADAPEPLDLPADRARPAVRSYRGATLPRTLAAERLKGLKDLCREEGSTLYAGASAALRVLFFRYTGRRDFVLGTSALGRPLEALHDQVGYYVNSLALREEVPAGTSFRALLKAVQASLTDAVRHGEYPFDRVVHDSGVITAGGHNPLFDVMVMMDPAWGTPTREATGLQVRHLDHPVHHSKMDLTLFLKETDEGLRITAEYATDLFDEIRVDRLLTHFETLLAGVVTDPGAPVEELELLDDAERELVLTGFNATDTGYETDTPVHHLFERQAARTPERTATVDQRRSLTFAELNARANALAWTLRGSHDVRPGTLVALYLERSVDMTAAILGVLKAGGAYLPVSTTDPADRVRAVLEDSGATLVLADPAYAEAPVLDGRTVVDVTALPAGPARTDDPPRLAGPGDVAYCIYTSGSTGVPNGVLVQHRGLVNRLRWTIDDLRLTERDVILQKTPYAFDVSVWELLLPGMIGARQVMLAPGGQSDPAVIRDTIERNGVTVLHFVPSMLGQYLSAVEGGFPGVRSVVCSGEELGRDLATRFLAATAGTGTRLHNYYGPTEATVDVSLLEVDDRPGPVTIGRPAANTRLYVLDDTGRPCPVGVPGELYISGVQVARGYLNRPEKNAEKFTADPFRPGARMYRTGDLARWQENGEVLYLGRRDHQVKLRGFRVELGEIEQALADQTGVGRAVVLVQKDPAGAEFLCAYVENATPAQPASPAELRAALGTRLPAYMVPTHYVFTDAVPVTRNGKADRRALLALGEAAQVAGGEYVAPRTDVERRLAGIWTDLLPVARVGAADDFFSVGGNSLSALQLSTRIRRAFGVELKLAALFTHRTVTAQAELIGGSAQGTASAPVVARVPRGERHVLSFAQERMWFLHQLEPDSGAYNIPVLARLDGALDAEAMGRAVADLVARHEMLRTTFSSEGGDVFQTVRDDLPVPYEVRDLSARPAEAARAEAARLVREIAAAPFALTDAAPLRVVLLRTGAQESQLLVVVHHIAGDGWTLRLMMQELSGLYTRQASGTGEPLPTPAVQYIDYAAAVRGPEYRAAVDSDLTYWVDRLTDAQPLELPTDELDEAARGVAGGVTTLRVAGDTGRRVRELASRTATTPFEITMAALGLLLSRLSDQQDVVVGFPVVGRPGIELEKTVGLFLNTLVLRTDLTGAPAFTGLLEQVSTRVREAYEHQAAPFELLVERLNPVRDLERTPVFNVLLNYLGDLREDLALDGVSAEVDDHAFDPLAKFPLTFYVRDEPDGGMLIEVVYRTDLFSAARAETMAAQLAQLLALVTTDPGQPITSYALTAGAAGSRRAALAAPLDAPEQRPVTELITAVAGRHPDRVAVQQGDSTLTYGELVARSEAVARRLVARGRGAGDVVAVTGPRGIGFVVGLLGVLRSGATAFPLDPALPEGRRRHLLEIGRPGLFVRITDGAPDAEAPVTPSGDPVQETVEVDARGLGPQDAADPVAADLPEVSAADPAYLFFTSGTTGLPKGVLGRHGSLGHFLTWQAAEFAIGEADRCSQLTSVSFDVMLRDTFLALVVGATVVVPEASDELGGKAVFRWLERERVTVLHAAPTVLQTWLLDAPEEVRLDALRLTFCAGEPLKAALVENIRARCPRTEVVNLYGPTETTLAKFFHRVPDGPLPPVLPVGTPLPQTQGLVLRGSGADTVLCGVGEPGEIVIRTPFRTFGYLDDQRSTDASFVRNPLREDPDDLLYRTGDIGRLRPDGLLEILGRADHQVKINGVRIQPAEVENALTGHPAVATGIVIAHKDENGEAHLVAYVVPEGPGRDGRALAETLRAHLTGLLPRAMVPGEYITLERIPTNANGKPDRAALPAPRFAREEPPRAATPPRSEAERRIRDVWTTVLERAVPGVEDDFFELGGTSLKLLRLYALLEERFPGTFRVAQLFAHPTIARQAALVAPTTSESEDEVTEHEF
ncbi:amino acid adenylation domain-containing protein [Streptomyces glaucus]|uniref:Carrier domain-containing protein n=1 Tax=Streptomyces glaucus TaxID=284029 RepID=A0ABN3J9D6_9ACTN